MLKIYNTLSRKKEEFKPINPPKVGMYICGPTVYDYAHIGHARTYTNSDVLARSLRWLGYQVKTVMNITDVGHLTSDADIGEDKMEKKAKQEKKTALEIAEFYTNDFWKMIASLNINKPNVVCRATDYIQEMIEMVQELEKKGFTYRISDGIYFDTSKMPSYGQLARLDIKGLKEGARISKSLGKKSPTDFALWKLARPGEKRQLEWDSPWGKHSFPGWHIECSAMSMKHLGDSFDIHTGGVDHIPVHHTNEIAQSQAVTGKKFVKYWFHNEFLMVEGEKMSKSLGNFVRVADVVVKGYSPLALRYLFLTAHYRTKMNFTWKGLKAASEAYERLVKIVSGCQKGKDQSVSTRRKDLDKKFKKAVENDLAIPQALAVVWEMVKSSLSDQDKLELIADWDQVLGLNLTKIKKGKEKIPGEIKKLMEERSQMRLEKKWNKADEVRKEIEKKGYQVRDTDQGSQVD